MTRTKPCIRCRETGNVEHDADNGLCNLCTDAIQGSWPPRRFDPRERMRCPACLSDGPHELDGGEPRCTDCGVRLALTT
jgi:hypothetical protein